MCFRRVVGRRRTPDKTVVARTPRPAAPMSWNSLRRTCPPATKLDHIRAGTFLTSLTVQFGSAISNILHVCTRDHANPPGKDMNMGSGSGAVARLPVHETTPCPACIILDHLLTLKSQARLDSRLLYRSALKIVHRLLIVCTFPR